MEKPLISIQAISGRKALQRTGFVYQNPKLSVAVEILLAITRKLIARNEISRVPHRW